MMHFSANDTPSSLSCLEFNIVILYSQNLYRTVYIQNSNEEVLTLTQLIIFQILLKVQKFYNLRHYVNHAALNLKKNQKDHIPT